MTHGLQPPTSPIMVVFPWFPMVCGIQLPPDQGPRCLKWHLPRLGQRDPGGGEGEKWRENATTYVKFYSFLGPQKRLEIKFYL